jgi:hypothetical protein
MADACSACTLSVHARVSCAIKMSQRSVDTEGTDWRQNISVMSNLVFALANLTLTTMQHFEGLEIAIC